MDEKYVRKYIAQLQALGYVERLGAITGGRENEARGIRFRILLPRMSPPDKKPPGQKSGGDNSPPIKEKSFKDNSKSVMVCDLCKEPPIGYFYPSGVVGQGPVKKCDHGAGD
jgi:hypothetical protein